MRQTVAMLALAGAMWGGTAGAQEMTPQEAVRLQQTGLKDTRPEPTRFNLNFAGGTVGEYVEAVRAANPGANIVAPEAAARFPMPPVELKGVTTRAALEAVSQEFGDGVTGKSWLHVRPIANEGSSEDVFQLNAGHETGRPNQTIVISLAELLHSTRARKLTVEDTLSAIEAATNMTEPAPKIRYHTETKLLLFHGTAEQVDTLHRTIEALGVTADAGE